MKVSPFRLNHILSKISLHIVTREIEIQTGSCPH